MELIADPLAYLEGGEIRVLVRCAVVVGGILLIGSVARAGAEPDCAYDLSELSTRVPQSIPEKPACSCLMPKALFDIEARPPEFNARSAFNHGDRRLRAVATLAHEPYTPGVENAKLRARLGELLIPGTQATPACYEHLRRMLLARQYAFEYNVALLSLIQGTSP